MSTTDLYERWVEEQQSLGRKDGIERGRREMLGDAYEARFGPMPEDVAIALERIHDAASHKKLLSIIMTGTPDEVARAVRSAASS